jgi:hypothetical protein
LEARGVVPSQRAVAKKGTSNGWVAPFAVTVSPSWTATFSLNARNAPWKFLGVVCSTDVSVFESLHRRGAAVSGAKIGRLDECAPKQSLHTPSWTGWLVK